MIGYGILVNLISDIIIAVIIVVVSWLWICYTYRRGLLEFFYVSKTKRLVIYLSNLTVLPFGSIGISGKKLSYTGDTVAYGEMQGAGQIRNLFSFFIPRLAEESKTIGKILLSDVDVQIIKSPKETTILDTQASFISLGSPGYNAGSLFIEKTGKSFAKFILGAIKLSDLQVSNNINPIAESSSDNSVYDSATGVLPFPEFPDLNIPHGDTGISFNPTLGTADFIMPSAVSIPSGSSILPEPNPNPSIPPGLIQEHPQNTATISQTSIVIDGMSPFTDTTYGFIERMKDDDSDRFLFYVAGLSEFATERAANYLATKWHDLHKKYNNEQHFLIMLKFLENNKSSVLFEKS